MRSFRYMGRDITVWHGHFLADADGSYHHVGASLADVVCAMIDGDASWLAGRQPAWEHPNLPFTVVRNMATRIPDAAVEDEPQGDTDSPIYRLDDASGASTFWLEFRGHVRALFTRDDAMAWRNVARAFDLTNADKGIFENLAREGY